MAAGRIRGGGVAGPEVLGEGGGFQGAAGFAGDDEERSVEVQTGFDAADGSGVGGVEDGELGRSLGPGNNGGHDLGREAAAAHAEKDHVVNLFGNLGAPGREVVDAGTHGFGHAQPAEAVGDLVLDEGVLGPEGEIGGPETAGEVVGLGAIQGFGDGIGSRAETSGGTVAGHCRLSSRPRRRAPPPWPRGLAGGRRRSR